MMDGNDGEIPPHSILESELDILLLGYLQYYHMCSTNMISILDFLYIIVNTVNTSCNTPKSSNLSCSSHKITACFQKTWNLTHKSHGPLLVLFFDTDSKKKIKKNLFSVD